MGGVVVNRHASSLKQQCEQLVDLYGAVDSAGDVDLDCPCRVMSNGCFEGRHVVGVPIREEVAGLLFNDVDIEATGQDPWIALLRQVRIK